MLDAQDQTRNGGDRRSVPQFAAQSRAVVAWLVRSSRLVAGSGLKPLPARVDSQRPTQVHYLWK
jgi:hypothetical protein